MSFGLRVKELRLEKNMSQGDLAGLLNVAQNHISRIESGKGITLDEVMITKLCAILNTTYEYLFEGKGSKHLLSDAEIEAAKNDAEALKAKMTKEEAIEHLMKLKQQKDSLVDKLKNLIEEQR